MTAADQPAVCDACGDDDQVQVDNGRALCRTCRPKQPPVRPFTDAAKRHVLGTSKRIREWLDVIERHLDDADELASNRPQTGEPSTTTQPSSRVLAEQGDHRAKVALAALIDPHSGLARQEDRVQALAHGLQALFRGPGVDETLFPGTLLGDTERDARAELSRLRALQERRAGRGEYVPVRAEEQPKAPKWKGSCLCRNHRHVAAGRDSTCRECGCLTMPKGA